MAEIATSAPSTAPSASPATIPATTAAVISGDTNAYKIARRAERIGKPLAAVPAPTPAAAKTEASATAAPVEHTLSRRQQAINDAASKAAETATATLREENAALKRQLDSMRAPHVPAPAPVAASVPRETPPAPAVPAAPEWKRFAQMADAPKLATFDTVEEHTAAMSLFIADKRFEERQAADRQRGEATASDDVQRARIDAWQKKMPVPGTPEATAFVAQLTPQVAHELKPMSALRPDTQGRKPWEPGFDGEVSGPINIIGEHVYDSPITRQMMLHFSTHPDDLARLITMPPEIAALPEGHRVRAHIAWMVKEYGKIEGRLETPVSATPAPPAPKTITSAPAPALTLGTHAAEAADPKSAAIRKGDTGAYRQLRRAERAAQLGR